MSVNEIRVFVFENYYKRIGFSKENSYYSMKNQKEKKALQWLAFTLTEKNPDPSNAKEYYQSFIRKKSFITKLVNESKIITQEPKTFESI